MQKSEEKNPTKEQERQAFLGGAFQAVKNNLVNHRNGHQFTNTLLELMVGYLSSPTCEVATEEERSQVAMDFSDLMKFCMELKERKTVAEALQAADETERLKYLYKKQFGEELKL